MEARQIDASDGKLTSDAAGEIELEGSVLVIRRISVHYKLRADQETRETVERVHSVYADHCPVSRSIRDASQIRTSFELIGP